MRFLKILAVYAGLSVFLVLLWLGLGAVELPETAIQWLWLIVLAVPLHLLGELIGHGMWNNRAARFVEQKTEDQPLSVFRMFYMLVAILFFAGAIIGGSHLWDLLMTKM